GRGVARCARHHPIVPCVWVSAQGGVSGAPTSPPHRVFSTILPDGLTRGQAFSEQRHRHCSASRDNTRFHTTKSHSGPPWRHPPPTRLAATLSLPHLAIFPSTARTFPPQRGPLHRTVPPQWRVIHIFIPISHGPFSVSVVTGILESIHGGAGARHGNGVMVGAG